MSSSKNGSITAQIIKGLLTLVVGIFAAKKGHDSWKNNKKNKSS